MSKEYDRQVQAELVRVRTEIPFPASLSSDDQLKVIWEKTTLGIANQIISNGWSDIRDFSAVNRMKTRFASFLSGVEYGRSGKLPGEYVTVITEWKKENDPEYAKYLELKAKFGD